MKRTIVVSNNTSKDDELVMFTSCVSMLDKRATEFDEKISISDEAEYDIIKKEWAEVGIISNFKLIIDGVFQWCRIRQHDANGSFFDRNEYTQNVITDFYSDVLTLVYFTLPAGKSATISYDYVKKGHKN